MKLLDRVSHQDEECIRRLQLIGLLKFKSYKNCKVYFEKKKIIIITLVWYICCAIVMDVLSNVKISLTSNLTHNVLLSHVLLFSSLERKKTMLFALLARNIKT